MGLFLFSACLVFLFNSLSRFPLILLPVILNVLIFFTYSSSPVYFYFSSLSFLLSAHLLFLLALLHIIILLLFHLHLLLHHFLPPGSTRL